MRHSGSDGVSTVTALPAHFPSQPDTSNIRLALSGSAGHTSPMPPLPLDIDLRGRIDPYFARILLGFADLEPTPGGLRLAVEDAPEGILSDAELNDLRGARRRDLPWRPPLRLEVEAVASHPAEQMRGTAGFGFWNDPFDPAQGTAAAPNAVWFFNTSPPANMPFAPGGAPHGWKAAALNGGTMPDWLAAAGAALLRTPRLGPLLYRVARNSAVRAAEAVLASRLDERHVYRIDWRADYADFWVDGQRVLRAVAPPVASLGFVAWVDNNCADETGTADLALRRLAVPQRQWLEISRIRIAPLAS